MNVTSAIYGTKEISVTMVERAVILVCPLVGTDTYCCLVSQNATAGSCKLTMKCCACSHIKMCTQSKILMCSIHVESQCGSRTRTSKFVKRLFTFPCFLFERKTIDVVLRHITVGKFRRRNILTVFNAFLTTVEISTSNQR